MKLSDMPNLGKVTEQRLMEVGIESPEQLREMGSKQAFLLLRTKDSGACINELMGLEGAVQGVRKYTLPEEVKADLKAFYKELGGEQ